MNYLLPFLTFRLPVQNKLMEGPIKERQWLTYVVLYLNTRQWQKAADMAKAVMDMNYFSLFS